MTATVHDQTSSSDPAVFSGENPFADSAEAPARGGTESGSEAFAAEMPIDSPFGDESSGPAPDLFSSALSQALAELHDEAFDEAVTALVTETEALVDDRFPDETPGADDEMRRLAQAHLAPVGSAVERYLEALRTGVGGLDLESLAEDELDHVLEEFDPEPTGLSPAAEQFLGGLVKKAKKAVKSVARKAKKVAGKALGSLVNAALSRLRKWANPLLKRVLEFAINKLPAPLRPPARILAGRFGLEAEAQEGDEGVSPAVATDPQELAESFDVAVATDLTEVLFGSGAPESFAEVDDATAGSGPARLAAARRDLVDAIRNAEDEEDLAPAIENFLPALLAALRLGIKLAGRKRVVAFLSSYVSRMIRRWVGPRLSRPLADAVVDTGLRLMSLEQPSDEGGRRDGVPVLLAGTIEDTIRRVVERDETILEDEGLARLAVAEAFEQAVAAGFPPSLVRPAVQQAPSVGGFFLVRGVRTAHPYRRYSQVPEVEIAETLARSIPSFGDVALAARLARAGDGRHPRRYRVHLYEAMAGSTMRHLARGEGAALGTTTVGGALAVLHPLTPRAAALLLHEPRLGVPVPPTYLASPGRIAVGQRFYALVPAEPSAQPVPASAWPSTRRVDIDPRRATVTGTFYASEAEAQELVVAMRAGRGVHALLEAFLGGLDGAGLPDPVLVVEGSAPARLSASVPPRLADRLRRRLGAWLAAAVCGWAEGGAEEFVRTALDPAPGVTVRVLLDAVPGLQHVAAARAGRLTDDDLAEVLSGRAFAAAPGRTVAVLPGRETP